MEFFEIKNRLFKGRIEMIKAYEYFKEVSKEKRKYKDMMKRVKNLPEEYSFTFEQIQNYMWGYCSGTGTDMMEIHMNLLELFEDGVENGKNVLDITGKDIAEFSDELLLNVNTYIQTRREKLNKDVLNKVLEGN